jgi:hypothetical protein
MLNRFASTRWIIRGGILLAGAATFVVACVSSDHPRPQCNDLADGGTVIEVAEASVYQGIPTTDAQTPEMLGADPDPGPTCTDCTQANDVEVLLVHDFEQGFAPTWFNYAEPGVAIAPQQVGTGVAADGTAANVPPPYWGLQVPDLTLAPGGRRCGSKYALHMAGGPFLTWGGGYVSRSVTVRGPANLDKYCPTDTTGVPEGAWGIGVKPVSTGDACHFFITPVAGQASHLGIDASAYEGISFWARRSPGAQSTLRIAVNDQNTSEGLALEVERENYFARQADPSAPIATPACDRVLSCCRQCREVTRDAPNVDSGGTITGVRQVTEKRCHVADERPPPSLYVLEGGGQVNFIDYEQDPVTKAWVGVDKGAAGLYGTGAWRTAYDTWDRDYKLCCPLTMDEEAERVALNDNVGLGDPQFGGRECSPYVFQYDYSSGYYCWAPGDPPLPERNENRCEDGFEANLNVDTEWRFYKVPWAELRRLTPNRKAIDTKGIWSVALFFGQGYLDTYVDDIGFYRKRR